MDVQLSRISSNIAELDPVLRGRGKKEEVQLDASKRERQGQYEQTHSLDPILVLPVRSDPNSVPFSFQAFAESDVYRRGRNGQYGRDEDEKANEKRRRRRNRRDSQGCTSPLDPIVKHVICIGAFGLKSKNVDSVLVNITGGR